MFKSLLLRFLRGGITSAIAAVTTMSFTGVSTWSELLTTLNGLALIGTIGFFSGVLLALDKYFRSPSIATE